MINAEIVDGEIRLDNDPRMSTVIRQIPGASWNVKQRYWALPISWGAMMAAQGILGDHLTFGPALLEWGWNKQAENSYLFNMRFATDWEGRPEEYPEQRVGSAWLQAAKWGLLADDLGKGKTVQTLCALSELPALIVCPDSVKGVWEQHVKDWRPDLTCAVARGTLAQRRAAIESDADVVVVNWEMLRSYSSIAAYPSVRLIRCTECGGRDETITTKKCQVHDRELNAVQWRTVVADECHRAKDPKALQTRALWSVSRYAEYRWALTGTPIADTPADAWAILHFLAPQEFPFKGKYVDRYVDVTYNVYTGHRELNGLRDATKAEFFSILDPHMLRRLRDPGEMIVDKIARECEMGPSQKKAYVQMRDGLVAEVEGGTVVGWNPLTQTGRLLQFAAALCKLDETGNPVLTDTSCKLDVLDEVLDELAGRPCVVYAPSRQLIELAEARLRKRSVPFGSIRGGIDEMTRTQSIAQFQAGRLPVMFLTAAGSEGITLTRADTIIYLQRPWSMITDTQVEGRIRRNGQLAERLLAIDLITPNTIEARVFELLETKGERLEELVRDRDKLKELLT